MLRRVRRTIRARALIGSGDRVAVAVSGGADSVALAWALSDLAAKAAWSLVGLLHVHHGLRPGDADADEQFVRGLAAQLGLSCHAIRSDVRSRADAGRLSVEAAARLVRYEALDAGARALGATLVATGHTRDDQAETVLLRLLRGAGSRGVSAVRPRRGPYVRPLIDCRRADVLADLEARGAAWREDRTNEDVSIPRNYLRHQVLPVIVREWPGAVAALARFAEIADDDEQFLTRTAAELTPAVTLSSPAGVQVLDVRGLRELPPALARRIVRQAIERADGSASFRDIEAVRRLAGSGRLAGHLDLSGLTVERTGPALRFTGAGHERPVRIAFAYELPIPGRVQIGETGAVVQASFEQDASSFRTFGDGETRAVVQASALSLPLTVRNRRFGDRFRPFGAPGRRKLQDVFVDRKVPRTERDRVPLVADAAGRIVWVAGVGIAEECRVTSPGSGVVILDFKKGNQ